MGGEIGDLGDTVQVWNGGSSNMGDIGAYRRGEFSRFDKLVDVANVIGAVYGL